MVRFVRHAQVVLSLETPASQWRLSAEGREATNRPDVDSHRAAVRAYLGGAPVAGWESGGEACARFAEALDGVDEAAVVTHATVLSLFLGHDFDAWARIGLPDVIEWQP